MNEVKVFIRRKISGMQIKYTAIKCERTDELSFFIFNLPGEYAKSL